MPTMRQIPQQSPWTLFATKSAHFVSSFVASFLASCHRLNSIRATYTD